MRAPLLLALGVSIVVVAAPSAARRTAEPGFNFRTPGGAVYCAMEFSARGFSSFRCVRPSDGFFIRLGAVGTKRPTVAKGHDPALRGFRDARVPTLAFGKRWFSSDAQLVGCQSLSTGLTCKQYYGLSFSLARSGGYRVFFGPEGYPPETTHLFRTDAVRCGISLGNLETSIPLFLCWRPSDGLELSLSYVQTEAAFGRNDSAVGFRPAGFPLLRPGETVAWRCTRFSAGFAEGCSTRKGVAIVTCTRPGKTLACRNRAGHGFRVDADAFELF